MKKRTISFCKVFKCAALVAAVFALSLPVSDTECKAEEAELVLMEEDPAEAGESSRENYWVVKVDEGYLALRRAKAYDSRNEIGKLFTGYAVEVKDRSDDEYWYVYSPLLDKSGYVNKDYLELPESQNYWTVSVEEGYLALRTEKAYDSRNEIGELYSGDVVEVKGNRDKTYWYVYAPGLGKFGYVNKDYLLAPDKSRNGSKYREIWTVKVDEGYLALRTEKAYDESNEIGKSFTGDVVEVFDSSDDTYWYVYVPGLYRFGYVNKNYLY